MHKKIFVSCIRLVYGLLNSVSASLNSDSGNHQKVFKRNQNMCSSVTRMGVQELPEYAASLQQCQKWKDRIEYYSDLRRKGGSAKKMEGWRTKRRKIKEKFRTSDCDQWRRKLK